MKNKRNNGASVKLRKETEYSTYDVFFFNNYLINDNVIPNG